MHEEPETVDFGGHLYKINFQMVLMTNLRDRSSWICSTTNATSTCLMAMGQALHLTPTRNFHQFLKMMVIWWMSHPNYNPPIFEHRLCSNTPAFANTTSPWTATTTSQPYEIGEQPFLNNHDKAWATATSSDSKTFGPPGSPNQAMRDPYRWMDTFVPGYISININLTNPRRLKMPILSTKPCTCFSRTSGFKGYLLTKGFKWILMRTLRITSALRSPWLMLVLAMFFSPVAPRHQLWGEPARLVSWTPPKVWCKYRKRIRFLSPRGRSTSSSDWGKLGPHWQKRNHDSWLFLSKKNIMSKQQVSHEFPLEAMSRLVDTTCYSNPRTCKRLGAHKVEGAHGYIAWVTKKIRLGSGPAVPQPACLLSI